MRLRSVLLLVGAMMLPSLLGCGANRRARRLEGRFSVGQPGEGWQRVLSGGADLAWFNESLSATIYADSNCAARFEDGELSDLLVHLTSGIARGEAVEVEERMMDGRAALLKSWSGSLDGVALKLATLTTKKDECLYDLVYIAPPARFDEGFPAFEQVLSGFATAGR